MLAGRALSLANRDLKEIHLISGHTLPLVLECRQVL